MTGSFPTGGQTDASRAAGDAAPVLVTGFGPFPGVADNPSGRFAREIDGAVIDGVPIVGRVVPVEWRRAWPTIREAVEQVKPMALLMYGVATQRARVEIERVARNVSGPRLDAIGELPADPWVIADAPSTLATRLPWSALTGPRVGLSDDAGDYLCNAVMYASVHRLGDRVRCCGFVHLPAHETEGTYAVLARLVRHLTSRTEPVG